MKWQFVVTHTVCQIEIPTLPDSGVTNTPSVKMLCPQTSFLSVCFHMNTLTYLLIYILNLHTYLLTPWSRVLLEMLTSSQIVKKFPAFYGTRRFITMFTNACHPPHPTSWRSILISSHLSLGLPGGLFPPGFPITTLYMPLLSLIHATCIARLILLDFITRTILGEEYRSLSSSLRSFFHSPVTSSLLGPHILLNTLFSNTLSVYSSLNGA